MSEPVQSERPLCCSLTIATKDGPIKEGKELSCGCGNRYKFTDGQWRMINPFQSRPSPYAVEPHTNQSCANCGGLLAPASGDTAKHFDGSYYCIANRTHAAVSTTPNEPDDAAITYSTKPGCPTCLSPQPHLHPAVQHEGEVSICKDPFHSQVTSQNPKVEMPIGLIWGEHQRDGSTHSEWYAPCGCALHPEPFPHVHPCSDGHKRPDLHATEEQAIVTAARDWAAAWGKVWEGDESATTESENEVNHKSKALHDAVLDLEREIVLRGRRTVMPDYDKRLEDWLS